MSFLYNSCRFANLFLTLSWVCFQCVWPLLKPLHIILVLWNCPLVRCINTNRLTKSKPSLLACGGVFRDLYGRFIIGFEMRLDLVSSFSFSFSLIHEVVIALGSRAWLEWDSPIVTICLQSSSWHSPWRLHSCWLNLLPYV